MSKCDMVLSRKVSSSNCRSSFKNSPGFPVPALETTRPMSRSSVAEASRPMKSSLETSSTITRCSTAKRLLNSTPTSLSKSSRRATRTMLIPEAAICRANSLPIPDEAPVTSAHGPNCPLSSAAFIVLFLFCRLHLLLDRSVSQRADPIFQALYLHHHQVGVISGVCHRSHTLKSTEEMRGKFSCILFMAGRPELLLEPAHWLGEERRGFLCESAALLVQLGTQAAQRTSPTRKLLPVPMNAFHKSKQPLLRRTQPVHLLPEFSKLRQAPLHNGRAKLCLGLGVGINVAYRDVGGFGDVRQARLPETVPIRQLHGGLNQPCPLVWLWFPFAHFKS